MALKCDFTGGKNIGDYTEVTLSGTEEGNEMFNINYTKKAEPNGDFSIVLATKTDAEDASITLDGNYVVDGKYFSLDVESIKFIEEGKTLFDFGFSLSFKPIDALTKPSDTPVYDVWEMDEEDFENLFAPLEQKFEDLLDSF